MPPRCLHPSVLLVAVTGAAFVGCVRGAEEPSEPPRTLALTANLSDDVVVAGGDLSIDVAGTDALLPVYCGVVLDGEFVDDEGGIERVRQEFPAEFVEQHRSLSVHVPWRRLERYTQGQRAHFSGRISVVVDDIGGTLSGVARIDQAEFVLVAELKPSVEAPAELDLYLGEVTQWPGQALLKGDEGTSSLLVEGVFDTGVRQSEIEARLPIDGGVRDSIVLEWGPGVFGVTPGTFRGSVSVVNSHTITGNDRLSEPQIVTITLRQTEIDGFFPDAAGRGGIVTLNGRGLIPTDPATGTSMFLLLEGQFVVDATEEVVDLTGDNALQLVPDAVPTFQTATFALRTETVTMDGREFLTGISARPGRFDGTVTAVLIDDATTVNSAPWVGSLRVLPTRQFVWVRFLPSFTEKLAEFGLGNVEFEVRERAFAVTRRDYDGFNIEFDDRPPDVFAEYATIEVGGDDPNNVGFFGLDNTAGKDVGNLRLVDYIGGENASTDEAGFFAYGGVFIGSFVSLSPTLSPESSMASARFDDLLSPFMPALGGTPVTVGEIPGGPRQAEIDAVVDAVGAIIGNTITHEVGHSLGLTFYPQDLEAPTERFHNEQDTPGAIMDSGSHRPFEERAELDGSATPHFTDENRAYLEWILPLQQ